MDSDEVKAALEYWHRNEPKGFRHELVTATLAAAYAAEHPPDADEPITPEWLPTIGAEYNDRDGFITQWAYVPEHADECVFVEKHDSDEHYTLRFDCDCVWPIPLYTRGQLLRLLKELEAT